MQLNPLIINIIAIAPVFSQYLINGDLRPDVTFGEHNDRFDMSPLLDYQKKYFRTDGSVDYRRKQNPNSKRHTALRTSEPKNALRTLFTTQRQRKKMAKKIKEETERQINNLANLVLLRMNSVRRGDGNNLALDVASNGDVNFSDTLGKFRTGPFRRFGGTEDEKNEEYRRENSDPDMFNYAFPIDIKVKGYLAAPVY